MTNPFRFLINHAFKKEMVDFFKNISIMVQSGIPLNESLGVLIPQTPRKSFRNFLVKTKAQIEKGSSLSNALTPYREEVGDLALNIIRAGEINGTLESNLQYLADIMGRNRDLKSKIGSAMMYPKIILGMVLIIGAGIAMFILPKLTPLFSSLDVELPLATRILLFISDTMRDHGILILVCIGVIGFGFMMLSRIAAVKWFYHTVAIRAPFFGSLVRNYQLALFCQIFGTLFRSGLTIKDTLTATSEALTNVRYRNSLRASTKSLTAGVPLATILAKYPLLFPQNVVAIITVGERSGKLEESFMYLAKYFDNEVDLQTKKLPTIIEPVLLMFIGIMVAFLMMAVMTPIYELTASISK
ncbi:type II secretion system F family protein [Patescibacteria group bacterium]|nr:type II secretion system F family protein [Patescibacteria group bacterium]